MPTKTEKQRRMQIRIRNGNRKLNDWPAPPRHKGVKRKLPHVCFNCRTSMKRLPPQEKVLCTTCFQPLAIMGPTFKTPRKSNSAQWRKVQILFENGETFSSYERETPLPKNLRELKNYQKLK